MKKLLSAVAVPKLGSGEYWDAIVPGLALRVGARRRTWTLRHRVGGTTGAIFLATSLR